MRIMTLEELTGKRLPNQSLKTANDVLNYIKNLMSSKKMTDGEFIDELAKLLALIGEECLDSQKVIGTTSYAQGPLLPEWDIKSGKFPFHIKDNITHKSVADPRVVLIGKIIHQVGEVSQQGHEYMYELYVTTGKYYHSYMSPLSIAWSGIGTWQY